MKVIVLMTAVVATLATRGAAAKVEDPTLGQLVAASDVVVLAKVDVVEPYQAGPDVVWRSATARVLETWYGDPGPQVRFRASRLFGCDISSAKVGETAVLFLGKPRPDGVRPILWWGRGGLSVRDIAGEPHVRLRSETFVPGHAPDAQRAGVGGWPVSYLKLTTFAASVRPMLMARVPSAGGIDDEPLDEVEELLAGYAAARARIDKHRERNSGIAIGFAVGCAATSLLVAVRRRRAARLHPG
jgi:hypothetical protein